MNKKILFSFFTFLFLIGNTNVFANSTWGELLRAEIHEDTSFRFDRDLMQSNNVKMSLYVENSCFNEQAQEMIRIVIFDNNSGSLYADYALDELENLGKIDEFYNEFMLGESEFPKKFELTFMNLPSDDCNIDVFLEDEDTGYTSFQ